MQKTVIGRKCNNNIRGAPQSLNERLASKPRRFVFPFLPHGGWASWFPGFFRAFFQLCRPRAVRPGPPSRGKWIIDGTKQWRSFVRYTPASNMCSTHSARLSIRQFCASQVAPAINRTSGPSYRIESSTVRYIWLSDRCLLKIIRNYNCSHIWSVAFKYDHQSCRF